MLVMKVLSIQSAVAYGHVGNSAAVFPLQRIGVEVLPVYTVNFSNHTGYGAWRGPLISPDDVREVITGIEERGGLCDIDVILSGYQGSDGIGDVILDAVARVKKLNPSAVYSCDPVMGNAKSGCFVAPAIPVLLRERVVPQADIITPNQFELGFLTETEPDTLESTLDSVDKAFAMGPKTVLVTSVERPDRPSGTIEMLAADETIRGWSLWAAIVILCREILVSGLREYLAAIRISVPVSQLAKWKTTVQLVALGFLIAGEAGEMVLPPTVLIGIVLLWISAILTIYTGWDYLRAGIHHLTEEDR